MKDMWKELTMPGLTWKQKAIVWYFAVVDAPIWGLTILVVNFANAARLIKKVPIPDNWDDCQ